MVRRQELIPLDPCCTLQTFTHFASCTHLLFCQCHARWLIEGKSGPASDCPLSLVQTALRHTPLISSYMIALVLFYG